MVNHIQRNILLYLFCFQIVFYFVRDNFLKIDQIIFNIISSAILAGTIFFSELTALFTIYSRMQEVLKSHHWQRRIKAVYSILGFFACLLGTFTYDFYGWLIRNIQGIANAVIPSKHILLNPNEAIQRLIQHINWAFLSAENIQILVPVLAAALGFISFLSISRRYGPRSRVYRQYEKSILKSLLYEQESKLEMICVGVGLCINYYFILIFLFFALVRHYKTMDFNVWIAERAMAQVQYKDTFDFLIFDIYQHVCILSFFFVPFMDLSNPEQRFFCMILLMPLIVAITLHLFYKTTINSKKMSFSLKGIFSFCFIVAGIEQFLYPEANPLVNELSLVFRPDSNFKVAFTDFSKAIFLAGLSFSSAEVWLDKDKTYRLNRDPFGCYFSRKLKFFLLSISIRAICFIMFFLSLGKGADDFIIEVIYYAFGILLVVLIDESGENFLQDLKGSYQIQEIEISKSKWGEKINAFLEGRNIFNLFWLVIFSLLALVIGHKFVKIMCVPLSLLVIIFYLQAISIEWATSKYYINFDARLLFIKQSTARKLTLGFWRRKDDNNEKA